MSLGNNNNKKINYKGLISAEKILKITNPVNWILSKRVREVFTMIIASTKIQLLWATARLLVTCFNPYLPSWRVLPKEIKRWCQSKISSYCFIFGVNQEN